ncbi:MAG TPA: DUF4118 domain-containing protein, partial [Spirochaetota bacterium]|nr:DUF4118 domain-containing protein [Spirochaetota bacterium]
VSPFRNYMKAALSVALVTAAGFMIVPFAGYWTIALLYLLCVVVLALAVGRGPVLLTAVMSGLLWNYLFIPPLFTFRIGKIEDVMMFAMFVVVALVLGGMTSKLHIKENALRKREVIISNLYELSNMFEDTHGIDDIVKTAKNYIRTYLGMESEFVISRDGAGLKITEESIVRPELSGKNTGIIDWVFRNGKPAGLFTDTLPKADALFLPMRSQSHVVGVAVLIPEDRSSFPIEREDFIQNVVSQISVRVERELLSSARRQSILTAESERLHKTLLNTISHELRTPITAITGASTSLLDEKVKNNAAIRDELLIEIKKAGERLNHLVDNLLDMSRLESGHLRLNREHHDM